VAELRGLKNALQEEIQQGEKSRFFAGRHGHFVEVADFNVSLLAKEMTARFPGVPKKIVESFTPFCVFLYHTL
jgi:hypothetical protein